MSRTYTPPLRVLSDQRCACGCGRRTYLAPWTRPRDGWVKGQPLQYVHGHQLRHSREEMRAYARERERRQRQAQVDSNPRWYAIIDAVAARFRLTRDDLLGRSQLRAVSHARVTAYLALADAGATCPHIAALFGRRAYSVNEAINRRRRLYEDVG